MKLRVVQWNISTMSRPKGIADFIEQRIGHSPALVCLDEVKRSSYDKLVGSLNPRSSGFSLDLRMPGKNEGKERGTGIAVLGFGMPIVSFELMDRVVFPELALLGIRLSALHLRYGAAIRYHSIRASVGRAGRDSAQHRYHQRCSSRCTLNEVRLREVPFAFECLDVYDN